MSDLPTLMLGKDTLSGWDIMVAYDETSLNSCLAASFAQNPQLLTGLPAFAATYTDPVTHKVITLYTVNLTFKTPTLQFDTSSFGSPGPSVVVTFPMIGTVTDASGSSTLPADLCFSACTPLLTVSGTAGTGSTAPAGSIVVFDPNHVSSENITLDFSKATFMFTVPPGSTTDPTSYNADMMPTVSAYFWKAGGFYYRLAGLTNAPNPSTASGGLADTLQPSKFLFTLDPGDPMAKPPIPGSLMTWISLVGSTSTPFHPSPRTPLLFTAGQAYPVCPLMADATASVILAHDTMWSFFFQPGMTNAGLTGGVSTSTLNQPGMTFTGTLPSTTVNADSTGNEFTGTDGFSFNMNNHASSFVVSDSGVALSYANTQTIQVRNGYPLPKGAGEGIHYGSADVTCTVHDVGTWISDATTNTLSLAFPSGPTVVSTTANPQDGGMWAKIFGGQTTIPASWRDLKVTPAPINLTFGTLDYFLTTNLLFPGVHVFTPDLPSTGLKVPRDTLLSGKLHRPSWADGPLSPDVVIQPPPPAATLSSLLDLLMAPAGGPILGDLMNALGTQGDPLVSMQAFFTKYNIEDWNGDELSPITGVVYSNSLEATTTPTGSDTAPTSSDTTLTPAFDVRLYGAMYTITAPSDLTAGGLLVNPQNGNITVQGVETAPTISTSTDGVTTVTVLAAGYTFAIVFSSAPNPSTGIFVLSFSGTVASSSTAAEKFTGAQFIPTTSSPDLGSGLTEAINLVALIGFGITVIGCLGMLQSWYYRREDKKTGEETPAATKRREDLEKANEAAQKQVEAIHNTIIAAAEARAARIDPGSRAVLARSVSNAVDSSVNDLDADYDASNFSEANLDGPPLSDVLSQSEGAAGSAIEMSTVATQLPLVMDDMSSWLNSGFIKKPEVLQEARNIVASVVQSTQRSLANSGYVRNLTTAILLDRKGRQIAVKLTDAQSVLTRLQSQTTRTKAEEARVATAHRAALDKLANETDQNKKQEEQEEVDRLQDQLDDAASEVHSAEREQRRQQEETERIDRIGKETETRREEAKKRARDAIEGLFHGD